MDRMMSGCCSPCLLWYRISSSSY